MIASPGLPFLKISGTGNDFLFVDLRLRPLSDWTTLTRAELVRRITHRRFGVGADGVVFVETQEDPNVPLRWDFFNDDGSHAEMCGNATRCMGRWAQEVLRVSSVRFRTVPGDVVVDRHVGESGEEFASRLGFIHLSPQTLTHSDPRFKGSAILLNTGVPHAVVEVDSVARIEDDDANIHAFRFHADAGSRGANVTFLERVGTQEFRTKSFERGVEGFTLSCGTGVLAAAAVGLNLSSARPPREAVEAKVETPGGRLRVRFEKSLSAVVLTGPASLVCAGVIDEGIIR